MPDLFFPDISNYQSIDVGTIRAACDVLLCEVSWGNAVTVPAGRMAALRAAHFDLLVWYVGLRSDQDTTQQAVTFCNAVGVVGANEALLIDWEATPNAGPTPSVAQREAFRASVSRILAVPASRIGTYGSASDLKNGPAPGWSIVASYETSEPMIPHTAWQFTNGSYVSDPYHPIDFPGIGFCDASVFHGSIDQLKSAFGLVPAPSPNRSLLLLGGPT